MVLGKIPSLQEGGTFSRTKHGNKILCQFLAIGQFSSHSFSENTVEPVYNGHPRDLRNWPLNTGGRSLGVV